MKKWILGLLTICMLFNLAIFSNAKKVDAAAATATYTVSTTTAVTKSGTAPKDSSATFKNTYTTKEQLTGGNSMTLTLSGYDGVTITGLTLSMKSNSKGGAGSLTAQAGNTTFASIQDSKFNTTSWNGAWSTSYVNIKPKVTSCTVGADEDIVIKISASANSIYCQSFTIDYEINEGLSDNQLVQQLVNGYVKDGSYTKKTTINLDENSKVLQFEFNSLFHANKVPALERTTYYNNDELLMTDKDETFTSGYGTVTQKNLSAVRKVNSSAQIGDMTHFTYNGTTQVYDYIVKKTHANWDDTAVDGMEGFYVTPKDFSADGYFTEGWTYNSTANEYTLKVLNSDEIVSDFINVVAPLLLDSVLTTNYIQVTSLVVKENATNGQLILQILAEEDEGKLGGSPILAEAIITKECEKEFGYVDSSQKYTHTFAKDQLSSGGTATLSSIEWTGTQCNYFNWDSNNGRGIQIGSSNNPADLFTLSTSHFNNYKINSIVVNASMGSGGNGKLTIKVGDTVVLNSQKLTTTATDYVATVSELSGKVSITLSASAKAMYIKSITVYYTVD